MKVSFEGIYKGIREVKAGTFVNSEGQAVNYKGGYKIIFDQLLNGIPRETELKITKEIALQIMPAFKPYDRFVINLDIIIYGNNNISVSVLSVEKK